MNKSHPFGLGWVPDLPDHRDKRFANAVTNSRIAQQAARRSTSRPDPTTPTKNGTVHTYQGWRASQCALEDLISAKYGEEVRQRLELAKSIAFGGPLPPRRRKAGARTVRPVRSRPLLLDEPPPASSLPAKVDLRPFMSPVEQQEKLSSCTAHAIIGLVEYLQIATRGEFIDGSRLFLYKATRNLLQWKGDSGAYLRDTIKALRLFGVCPERYWEYDSEKIDEEPSTFCYSFASNYKSLSYYRLENLTEIKRSLAQGYPVALGFTCFESVFLDRVRRTGFIPYPQKNERNMGGHAVLAVGYYDVGYEDATDTAAAGHLIIRNSWGTDWGASGFGYLPFRFIAGNAEGVSPLSEDYWTMTRMEIPDLSDSQAAPFTIDDRRRMTDDGRPTTGDRRRRTTDDG